jgi:hypothetical protein
MKLLDKVDVADLDYSFDFANRLPTGDVFVSAASEVRAGDVTVHNVTCAGTVITFWLSGGTKGMACEVLIKGVTQQGRTPAEPAFVNIIG